LSYSDKVPDGFYHIQGMDPFVWTLCNDLHDGGRMPSIESLRAVDPADSAIQVVMVDKVADYDLRQLIDVAITTGNAASTESSLLCREPDPKLSAQRRFAESKGFSSRHRKNPRYRVPVPRGNSAASRHRRPLTAQRICAESCRSGPSAQPPPHGAT
jgi:serine/threonine-protein kinase CTR1